MQRLRLRFGRGEDIKFLSHLDVMRLWERILRRCGLPLSYSEGFSPHPRIALAAPLPVGVTSQHEIMDVFLMRWIVPASFVSQVKQQLPKGLDLLEAWTVGANIPSLQSQVRFAEYEIEVQTEEETQEVESAIRSLLSAKELQWHHLRDTGARYYDLRTLIDDIWLIDVHDSLCVLGMRLRCDPTGTGRPEQVAKALGFANRPISIHRTRLILS